jgi:hypothetical protein
MPSQRNFDSIGSQRNVLSYYPTLERCDPQVTQPLASVRMGSRRPA